MRQPEEERRPAIEGAQCLAHFGLQLGYEPVRIERKVQRLVVFVAARLETVGRSSLEYDSRNDARASDLIPFICILYLELRDGKPIFRNLDELNWSRSRDKAEEASAPHIRLSSKPDRSMALAGVRVVVPPPARRH